MIICPRTGKLIEDSIEALKISLTDILTTPLGSRVLRRDYGCRLFDYIDSPMENDIFIYEAITEAIARHEPDVVIKKMDLKKQGSILSIFLWLEQGVRIRIDV